MELSEDLFLKLRARLLKLAELKINRREDAEDVVQEVMSVVVERYSSMQFEKGYVYWAFAILRNKILRYYRDKMYAGKLAETVRNAPVEQDSAENPEANYIDKELELHLSESLRQIDGNCRKVLLSLLDGRSREEIAKQHNLSLDALYSRVSRCKKRLMEILHKRYPV